MKTSRLRKCMFSVVLFCSALCASAQTSAPVLVSGTVFDSSGAVIPHATVHLRGSRGEQTTLTDGVGHFAVSALPGSYDVQVEASGFEAYREPRLRVQTGHSLSLHIALPIATDQQDVNVSSEASLSTDAAANKSALVFKGEQLNTFSDDPRMMQLQLQALSGGDPGGAAPLYVDGFSNGTMPAKESIREVHINQNPFTAQAASTEGAASMCLRSLDRTICMEVWSLPTATAR